MLYYIQNSYLVVNLSLQTSLLIDLEEEEEVKNYISHSLNNLNNTTDKAKTTGLKKLLAEPQELHIVAPKSMKSLISENKIIHTQATKIIELKSTIKQVDRMGKKNQAPNNQYGGVVSESEDDITIIENSLINDPVKALSILKNKIDKNVIGINDDFHTKPPVTLKLFCLKVDSKIDNIHEFDLVLTNTDVLIRRGIHIEQSFTALDLSQAVMVITLRFHL